MPYVRRVEQQSQFFNSCQELSFLSALLEPDSFFVAASDSLNNDVPATQRAKGREGGGGMMVDLCLFFYKSNFLIIKKTIVPPSAHLA